MNISVRRFLGTSALSVTLVLASGVAGLAKNSESVILSHDVVVNGATLPAGHYTVQWETHSPEATVQFVQHHKVVLTTEGKILNRRGNFRSITLAREDQAAEGVNASNPGAVVYSTGADGTMSLVEIHFALSNKVLVFNQ